MPQEEDKEHLKIGKEKNPKLSSKLLDRNDKDYTEITEIEIRKIIEKNQPN